LLFGVNSLGIVAGVQTSSRLVRKVPPQWILACSTAWMFLMAVLIVIFDQLGFGLWGVMVPLWFYILGGRLTFPSKQALALAKQGAHAGTAERAPGSAALPNGRPHAPVLGRGGAPRLCDRRRDRRLIGTRLGGARVLWHGGRPGLLGRRGGGSMEAAVRTSWGTPK